MIKKLTIYKIFNLRIINFKKFRCINNNYLKIKNIFWEINYLKTKKYLLINKIIGLGVEYILRESMNQKSLDNITVVMIAFQNFKKKLFGNNKSKKRPLEEKSPLY